MAFNSRDNSGNNSATVSISRERGERLGMTLAMGSHLSAQRKKKKKKRGNQSG
jgi:hypothetical protein